MVLISIRFEYMYIWVVVSYLVDYALEVILNTFHQDFPAILGRKYHVISGVISTVALPSYVHPMILSREDRGSAPHPRAYARGIG